VTIKLDTGGGLVTVYGPSSGGIALNFGNKDDSGTSQEGADYDSPAIASGTNYTLTDGYADNEHGGSKFPTPFDGATNPAGKKNTFIGAAVGKEGSCPSNCYDGGVILITGVGTNPPLGPGDTATIGFWHNKNGQATIQCLNGGGSSTALSKTLALTYPHLFGSLAVAPWVNLAGDTNADVAAQFLVFFGQGGMKWEAQVMGAALAAYVTSTTSNPDGCGGKFGFNFSAGGTGTHTFTITDPDASAIGLAPGTYTINQLLAAADAHPTAANALNDIFDAINSSGDIH
jgi:hypothetical protein